MKLFMLLAALLCSSLSAQAPFATLEHARAYAASVPEYPVIDNNDWLNPDFTTFHKTLAPSWWQRVAHVFGAAPQPAWTPQSCVALLERTAAARKKK